MRIAKEIRRYLKQQHWYKEYVREVSKFPDYIRIRALRGYFGIYTIGSTFFWDDTPQNVHTWSHRDYLFIRWYNRGKKKYGSKKVSSPTDGPQGGSRTD